MSVAPHRVVPLAGDPLATSLRQCVRPLRFVSFAAVHTVAPPLAFRVAVLMDLNSTMEINVPFYHGTVLPQLEGLFVSKTNAVSSLSCAPAKWGSGTVLAAPLAPLVVESPPVSQPRRSRYRPKRVILRSDESNSLGAAQGKAGTAPAANQPSADVGGLWLAPASLAVAVRGFACERPYQQHEDWCGVWKSYLSASLAMASTSMNAGAPKVPSQILVEVPRTTGAAKDFYGSDALEGFRVDSFIPVERQMGAELRRLLVLHKLNQAKGHGTHFQCRVRGSEEARGMGLLDAFWSAASTGVTACQGSAPPAQCSGSMRPVDGADAYCVVCSKRHTEYFTDVVEELQQSAYARGEHPPPLVTFDETGLRHVHL